jgi:hypothetical protein
MSEKKIDTGINQTADKKYYASCVESVINNDHVLTRKGRVGDPVMIDAPAVPNPNDTSTDRYYRSGGSVTGRRGQPVGKVAVPSTPQKVGRDGVARPTVKPGQTVQVAGAGAVSRPIRVTSRDGVTPALLTAAAMLTQGEQQIFIEAADAQLERRLITAVDLGLARGELTQAQARRIRISIIPSREQLVQRIVGGVKVPEKSQELIDPIAGIDDFDKFVKGEPELPAGDVVKETVVDADPLPPIKPIEEPIQLPASRPRLQTVETTETVVPITSGNVQVAGPTPGLVEGPRGRVPPPRGAAGRVGKANQPPTQSNPAVDTDE